MRPRQEGFTYLGLIVLVTVVGLVGAATLKIESLMRRAEAEEELLEIRRIWRYERHDWHDALPRLYQEETGLQLRLPEDDQPTLGADDEALLGELAVEHDVPLGLVKQLIDTERELQGLQRRSRIMDQIGAAFAQEWRSEDDIAAEIAREEAKA